jgi:hypothetical protein
MSYIDIREPGTGKFLFKYDPERRLIQVQRRGIRTIIDLAAYDPPKVTEKTAAAES